MPTEKDAAEAERILGDYYNERDMPKTAKVHYELADSFDPPKPKWADGSLYRVTIAGGERYVTWSESEGMWALGGDDFGSLIDEGDAQKAEPLRVLADDEIALPEAAFGYMSVVDARNYASTMERHGWPTAYAVFTAYAAALEAEEATR